MGAFRLYLLRHHWLAAGLVLIALVMKLLVPTGYMIGGAPGRVTLELCSGVAEPIAMPGMSDHGKSKDHGKVEMPCAFAGLSAAALDTIDPIQLAALIAFIVAVGLTMVSAPAPRRRLLLRPPLRGPPLPL